MAHIRQFGWSLVTEYDADKLTDDSDDEWKMEKVEGSNGQEEA